MIGGDRRENGDGISMISMGSRLCSYVRSEHLRVLGVEVLSYRISLPLWEEAEKISSFYREIGERAEVFCKERLFPLAQKDYEASEDPRKRFRYAPYSYTLEGKITGEREGLLSVCLEVGS